MAKVNPINSQAEIKGLIASLDTIIAEAIAQRNKFAALLDQELPKDPQRKVTDALKTLGKTHLNKKGAKSTRGK